MPKTPETLAEILEQEERVVEEIEQRVRAEFESKKPDPLVVEKIVEKTAKDEIAELKAEGKTKEEIKEAMDLLINEEYGE